MAVTTRVGCWYLGLKHCIYGLSIWSVGAYLWRFRAVKDFNVRGCDSGQLFILCLPHLLAKVASKEPQVAALPSLLIEIVGEVLFLIFFSTKRMTITL